jgi:hypothetical protein
LAIKNVIAWPKSRERENKGLFLNGRRSGRGVLGVVCLPSTISNNINVWSHRGRKTTPSTTSMALSPAKGCSLKLPVFMPEWEDREFILRSAVSQPNLILSKGLVKTMGIHLIGQLPMAITDFKSANITWILTNIKCMPSLKYFLLNAALPIARILMVFNVYVYSLSSCISTSTTQLHFRLVLIACPTLQRFKK